MHPEETRRNTAGLGGRGNKNFAGDTERSTGEDQRRTREHLSRAEALGPDIHEVVGTSLAYAITHPNIVEYEQRRARERSGFRSDLATSAPVGAEVLRDAGRVTEKLAEKAGVALGET